MHKKITLENVNASLQVDLFGGAITDFHLQQSPVNPLSFQFATAAMPPNNRKGAPYQGHFLCLGRWGEPSEGEQKAGLPNHGQPANILWKLSDNPDHYSCSMEVTSPLEGLQVERVLTMHRTSPAYIVRECVTNSNPLGRLYNMVQHPTLSAPFLHHSTVVQCNAGTGFNDAFNQQPEQYASTWPEGLCEDGTTINLDRPEKVYNSVFSFIIPKEEKYGWVIAWSPAHQLMIGYLWQRKEYPWINLWQDWEGDRIRYRGIEFGTTGIHKPFHLVLADNNTRVFGEPTIGFIDAGEKVCRHYLSFLHKTDPDFTGIDKLTIIRDQIVMTSKNKEYTIDISSLIGV